MGEYLFKFINKGTRVTSIEVALMFLRLTLNRYFLNMQLVTICSKSNRTILEGRQWKLLNVCIVNYEKVFGKGIYVVSSNSPTH